MADLPILFSAPMVRALIAGTKTQTRRLIKFDGVDKVIDFVPVATDPDNRRVFEMKDNAGQFVARPAGKGLVDYHFSPRIGIGDRLYVREAWRVSQQWDETAPRDLPARRMTVFCEAGGSIANQASGRWEPDNDYPPSRPDWVGKHRQAMHMPKWASRITLIVEDVRIHRLNSFDHEDARAEGVTWNGGPGTMKCPWGITGIPSLASGFSSAENAFAALWDHINGGGAWESNPWVIAYTFRRIMGNIDQLPNVNSPQYLAAQADIVGKLCDGS